MIVWTSIKGDVPVLLAASSRGLCRLSFGDESAFERELKAEFGEIVRKDADTFL